MVILFIEWKGIDNQTSKDCYELMSTHLAEYGEPDQRKCESNKLKNCICQGLNPKSCGASFSFGCTYSIFYDGCKHAPNGMKEGFDKFQKGKMSGQKVKNSINDLATKIGQKTGIITYIYRTHFFQSIDDKSVVYGAIALKIKKVSLPTLQEASLLCPSLGLKTVSPQYGPPLM